MQLVDRDPVRLTQLHRSDQLSLAVRAHRSKECFQS